MTVKGIEPPGQSFCFAYYFPSPGNCIPRSLNMTPWASIIFRHLCKDLLMGQEGETLKTLSHSTQYQYFHTQSPSPCISPTTGDIKLPESFVLGFFKRRRTQIPVLTHLTFDLCTILWGGNGTGGVSTFSNFKLLLISSW